MDQAMGSSGCSCLAPRRCVPFPGCMRNVCIALIAATILTPAGGLQSSAAEPGAGDDLFADGAVTHLRIEVPTREMEILRGYAFRREALQEERQSVHCTLREGN